MIRVLFVDDEPKVLEGLQRLLRKERREWEMRFALGPSIALDQCEEQPFDLIVTDMRMPEMDGATLLAAVQQRFPATVRFLLSGQTQPEAARRAVRVAHQFLTKPSSAEAIKAAVHRVERMRSALSTPAVAEYAGRVSTLLPSPKRLATVREILRQASPSRDHLTAEIAKDVALSAKVLQLVNSSFFGHATSVESVRLAVDLLGTATIRELVRGSDLAPSWPEEPTALARVVETLNEHFVAVACTAREMATPQLRELAFVVGLLGGVGHLIRLDQGRGGVALGAQLSGSGSGTSVESIPPDEVGSYLLGLWNLPESITTSLARNGQTPGQNGGSELTGILSEAESAVAARTGDLPGRLEAAAHRSDESNGVGHEPAAAGDRATVASLRIEG